MPIVTGKMISQLAARVVSLLPTDLFAIETSDGLVVQEEIGTVVSAGMQVFDFIEENFTGTTLDIPVGVNGGKISATDAKIEVYTDGSLDYRTLDYTITRNGIGVPDEIEFTAARNADDIYVRFTL